ncbi:MAG TPA: UrcA family protein [Sphingomicrobium sp.]|nr:UrcA family protein [Sphingomicrobium sp.]
MLKTLPALAALAVAAALVIPTVGFAAEQHSARVSYADLNLATRVGQQKLKRRIAFAASNVCETADRLDLVFARAVTECRDGAIADAQPAYRAAIASAQHPSVTVLEATSVVVTAH